MKFENTEVFNFKGAFRGMRNPMNSWHLSDSAFATYNWEQFDWECEEVLDAWIDYENVERRERGWEELGHDMENYDEYYDALEKYEDYLLNNGTLTSDPTFNCKTAAFLGPNDLNLAQRLIAAGPEHCKFLRQIFVSVDITAPLYWWKEFDTYKIGTTANSTSTMHKLTSKPITVDCFELDDYEPDLIYLTGTDETGDNKHQYSVTIKDMVESEYGNSYYEPCIITFLEDLRQKYLETKDKKYWKELVRWLPNGWLQTRTITMSYANLRNMYFQRQNHKLTEWHKFCQWVRSLPYAEELIIMED